MELKNFTDEEILQLFNLIGLSESEIDFDYRHYEDGSDIEKFMDLYMLLFSKYNLSKSSQDIAARYSLLLLLIKNDFWFTDGVFNQDMYEFAMNILGDVTSLSVVKENDSKLNFERTSELINAALGGLCSCNPLLLNLVVSNLTPSELLTKKARFIDLEIDQERILYELIMLSRLPDIGEDYDIFDENNKISEKKLLNVIKKAYRKQLEINNRTSSEEKTSDAFFIKKYHSSEKKKSLIFRRPTIKELNGD